ncbi:hypothetical protein LSTR_LSTR001508 [Laodelphax striatellus]|uniref:Endonuclease/exonuclease/phosphatase domain-containing protein n=1 Tax=Laodelphax striatellus TaxID=195883 RepID=A0A482XAH4_LAOST|nr:hypothetical protein LSTR_LSTR001508 [Laodelphax striatellus]
MSTQINHLFLQRKLIRKLEIVCNGYDCIGVGTDAGWSLVSSLRFCHINAESLPGHFDDFREIFSTILNFDVIGVSESWLKPSLNSSSFCLPDIPFFVMIESGETGVFAVYVRSSLSPKHVLSSPQPYSNSPEFIFVEITACQDKNLIGIVYRPPKRVGSHSLNTHYYRQFNQSNSTSTLWDNVRRLGAHKGRSNTEINIPLDELNDFFTHSSNQPDASNSPLATDHLVMQFSHNLPEEKFFFSHVTPSVVAKAILSSSKNSKGKFPDLWKCSMVKPIPKTANPTAPADCRPIHILCSISKALERIVHAQRSLNYAVRYIYDADVMMHITPYFMGTGLAEAQDRRRYFLLILV